MQKYLIIGLSAVVLSACTTSAEIASKDIGSIAGTDKGVIIASYGGERRCENLRLQFKNTATGETVTASRIDAAWMKAASSSYKEIGLTSAAPGEYKFSGGTCNSGGATVDFRGVNDWFKPFAVNAGEAVYPGTLVPETLEGTNASGQKATYVLYNQADRTDLVRTGLAEKAPLLTGELVTRLAPRRLEPDTVKRLIGEASVTKDEKDDTARLAAARKANTTLAFYLLTGKVASEE